MEISEKKSNLDLKLSQQKCELRFLNKSDGSAVLSQGKTVVLASANGPLDIVMSKQSLENATVEVLFQSKSGKPSVGDRYKESVIRQTCEMAIIRTLYPRSGIYITIQELEDNGGLIACCLNAACLALLNSGINMNFVFAAITCAIDDTSNVILDPSADQCSKASAILTFVIDNKERKVLTCIADGKFRTDGYNEALAISIEASNNVFEFYRDVVRKYCKHLLK